MMAIASVEVSITADASAAVRALRQAALTSAQCFGGADAVAELLREWADQEGMALPTTDRASIS